MKKTNGEQTLCWYCDNACGDCDWSAFGKPIKKWLCKKSFIDNGQYGEIESYIVRWCPQYKGNIKGVVVPLDLIQKITKLRNEVISSYKLESLLERSPVPFGRTRVESFNLYTLRKGDYRRWKSQSKLTENDIEL